MNTTRRNFLTGTGCLVAASALPSAALADAFSKRGRFERLSVSFRRITAGASKPFSLLHISDTHFTAAYGHEDARKHKLRDVRTATFGGRQEEAIADSLAWAKDHVDYVVHTGDLIDWQSEANFDLVRKYFGQAAGMMFGAVGNHEYSRYMWLEKSVENEAYKNETRDLVSAAYPFDITLASTVVNGVNFVSIDDSFGTVTESLAGRFEKEVAKGLPIVLVKHVPFSTPRLQQARAMYWRRKPSKDVPDLSTFRDSCKDKTTTDFVAYLKAQPLLKGILAGHLHFDIEDRFSPTAMQYVVGPNFLFHGSKVVIV